MAFRPESNANFSYDKRAIPVPTPKSNPYIDLVAQVKKQQQIIEELTARLEDLEDHIY